VESITKNSWLAHQVQYMTDFKNGEEIWCIFRRMWINGLKLYDEKVGINWKWQSMDGVITKAPLGGKKHRTKSN
jgi:hypothetical protein